MASVAVPLLHRTSHAWPIAFLGVMLPLATLIAPAVASAEKSANILHLQTISGVNERCQEDVDAFKIPPGTEDPQTDLEPSVAVNPTNPRNIIATWQFGKSPRTSLYGVALSQDSGATWQRVEVPGLSLCTGGIVMASQDPGISFAPDGTAYIASQNLNRDTAAPAYLYVNRSEDGGRTWSQPVTVSAGLPDKQRAPVVGDPRAPGKAYIVWPNLRPDLLGGDLFFSSTADGGKTWSPQRLVFLAPDPHWRPLHPLLEVLPDGTLLVTFSVIHARNYALPGSDQPPPAERHEILAVTSRDGGLTWSLPRQVAQTTPMGPHLAATDPDTGRTVISIPHSQFTSGPDGTAYVVWHEIVASDTSNVMVSKSRDGGDTWTTQTVVTGKGIAVVPSVAVMPDGTIGLSWYDTRRDIRGDDELTTDYWFAQSRDGGITWREQRVAGPFDLNASQERKIELGMPVAGAIISAGLFGLGEYTGLSAHPGGFATTFGMAQPQSSHGSSDIFFARLKVR